MLQGDHDCMLYLNKPFRLVARDRVYHTVAGDSLHNMALLPEHGKVSIEVVQRHEEDFALPIPNEQANLYSLRDVIGKGLGKETGYSKESIVGPSNKGSTDCVSSEILKLAEAQGAACLDMMKLFVRSDQVIDTATIQLTSEHCGKEFCDIVGKENIIEVICRHWLSASSINLYIQFSFISLYEMDEALNPNPHQHIAEMLKRHMGEDHLIFAPYNVGALVTYRAERGVQPSSTKMSQTKWVTVQCPKQTNNDDCGYYACLFIGDALHHGQTYFPEVQMPTFLDNKICQL
ncbi:uncharacterized protein LOC113855559 [Abrus precatorius]|uniref:Uncharacterized protein LOC113855559 n=1 Tax=Abrus precatorius TaxID=3816 RepID=A0A8B8KJE7_ABRPR|nr:uncharacterized protein LOC113855559 [Abrus precatorius]